MIERDLRFYTLISIDRVASPLRRPLRQHLALKDYLARSGKWRARVRVLLGDGDFKEREREKDISERGRRQFKLKKKAHREASGRF